MNRFVFIMVFVVIVYFIGPQIKHVASNLDSSLKLPFIIFSTFLIYFISEKVASLFSTDE
jgi:hypothetical protein